MIRLDSTTAVVFNTDDLRDAVNTDNGISLVYFGADITLAYGIAIYPGKPSLTFDGTYEGVTHTFTDMNNSAISGTLGLRAASAMTITFRNINLIGRNYYGIPYVPIGTAYSGVSTLYERVTYVGTQLTYNPNGFTRFTDCHITVNHDEAAETGRLEIAGETTIVKTNDANAVFWFRGNSAQRPHLKICTGATVSITTAHYFMYESYPPDVILEPGAHLSVATNSGFGYTGDHTVHTLLVGAGASFRFTQAVNRGYPTLCMDGPLTVAAGANFYMQADFANRYPLIRFPRSTGGLAIQNPKSFVLYNRGSASATAFQFAAAIPVSLCGGQLNVWETATPFPDAGTLEDTPDNKWNRPSYEPFTLTGTANSEGTHITGHDFTPEELADLPPLEDLSLAGGQVFSMGEILLELYSTVVTRLVTGRTEPHATVQMTLIPAYYLDPQTAIADDTGLFGLTPTTPTPFSQYVEVTANTPFLIVSQLALTEEEDVLFIESAPEKIGFPVQPITGLPGVILPRDAEHAQLEVVVVDTRQPREPWQLWVKVSGPLTTEAGDLLDDAVVFGTESGALPPVETVFRVVRTGEHEEMDRVTLTWPEDRGVLVRIAAPMRSGKPYTTVLGWAITPMGVQPEEVD